MLDLIVLLVVIALLLLLNTRSWFRYAESHQIGVTTGGPGATAGSVTAPRAPATAGVPR